MNYSEFEIYDALSGWVEDVAPESYLNQGAVKLGQIAGREADAMKGNPMEKALRDMEKADNWKPIERLFPVPTKKFIYPYFG